jgi:hypothetical protein
MWQNKELNFVALKMLNNNVTMNGSRACLIIG